MEVDDAGRRESGRVWGLSRTQFGVILAVVVVAMLCQVGTALRPGRTWGNLEWDDTYYGIGWPREFVTWHVSNSYECKWPPLPEGASDDLLFSGDPVIRLIDTRVEWDLSWRRFANLLMVIAWWTAIAGCLLAAISLVRLRWNIRNLLLLQASVAVLVLLQ